VRNPTEKTQQRWAGLPRWFVNSRKKLLQFLNYVCNVYDIPRLLSNITDTRRAAEVPTFDVINSLFQSAVLRIPSINALEGNLKEADFQRLIGRKPNQDVKVFSADVVANVLDKLNLDQIAYGVEYVIGQAERNKTFREGSYGMWLSTGGSPSAPTTDTVQSVSCAVLRSNVHLPRWRKLTNTTTATWWLF
jgi:hypothetical protein